MGGLHVKLSSCLQERNRPGGRQHIPYRNSMMTTVLRDSLGGNCCTAMIATISPAPDQLPEAIATCRFAQRVAQISNQVCAAVCKWLNYFTSTEPSACGWEQPRVFAGSFLLPAAGV